jgi:hypothetical protein
MPFYANGNVRIYYAARWIYVTPMAASPLDRSKASAPRMLKLTINSARWIICRSTSFW